MARVKREQDALLSADWMKNFPIAEMEAPGWIPKSNMVAQKVMALFNFFGISSEKAWTGYYINKELKVMFSISLLQTKNPYAISAWLRQGELTATEMSIEAPYNKKKLKSSLTTMKEIMIEGEQYISTSCRRCVPHLASNLYKYHVPEKCPTQWCHSMAQ